MAPHWRQPRPDSFIHAYLFGLHPSYHRNRLFCLTDKPCQDQTNFLFANIQFVHTQLTIQLSRLCINHKFINMMCTILLWVLLLIFIWNFVVDTADLLYLMELQ